MKKTLEKSARTVDAAIEEALKALGLGRDDVEVEVLDMGKTGFLGIGAVPARVRVSYEAPDEPETPVEAEPAPAVADENADYAAIRAFLSGLLERMGVNADIEISPRDNGGINVNLTGSAMGAIIGRRGETLDAIQHLTNYVVNKDSEKHLHISVDAEAYRSKREESLTKLAEKMAEKAIKYKRSMALEPMNSYERHVIHTALQNYEGVTTSSTGVEPNRRVVVSYVRPDKPERSERPARSERPRPERAEKAEKPVQAAPVEQPERPAANKPQSREWA